MTPLDNPYLELSADTLDSPWSLNRLLAQNDALSEADPLAELHSFLQRKYTDVDDNGDQRPCFSQMNIPYSSMASFACQLLEKSEAWHVPTARALINQLARLFDHKQQQASGDGSSISALLVLCLVGHISAALQQRCVQINRVRSDAADARVTALASKQAAPNSDQSIESSTAHLFVQAWPHACSSCGHTAIDTILNLFVKATMPHMHAPRLQPTAIMERIAVLLQAVLTIQLDGPSTRARWAYPRTVGSLCEAVCAYDGLLQLVLTCIASSERAVAFCCAISGHLRGHLAALPDLDKSFKERTIKEIVLLLQQLCQLKDTALIHVVVTPEVLMAGATCAVSVIRKALLPLLASFYAACGSPCDSPTGLDRHTVADAGHEYEDLRNVARAWLFATLTHRGILDKDAQIRKSTAQAVAPQLAARLRHVLQCQHSVCLHQCSGLSNMLVVRGESSVTVVAGKLQAQTDVCSNLADAIDGRAVRCAQQARFIASTWPVASTMVPSGPLVSQGEPRSHDLVTPEPNLDIAGDVHATGQSGSCLQHALVPRHLIHHMRAVWFGQRTECNMRAA
jgi:hypothetical protein